MRVAVLSFLLGRLVLGAACCGGGSNFPAFLSGEDRGQVSLTTSYQQVVADVTPDGEKISRRLGDTEGKEVLAFDGALLAGDRWQWGVSGNLQRRARSRSGTEASSTGVGDFATSLSYEFLPDWEYSAWRPRGLWFFKGTAPLGKDVYESSELYRVDVHGKGFWSVATGVYFTKTIGSWDVFWMTDLHRSFSKSLDQGAGRLNVNPGWGASSSVGAGFSPGQGKWRLGLSVTPSWEEPVRTTGLIDSSGTAQALWDFSAQLGYQVEEDMSVSVTYLDQELLGGAKNAALNRGVALLLQKRWER